MNVLGIEFAPIMIPMARRLQALSAFFLAVNFILLGPITLVVGIYLLFTPFYYVPLAYSAWMILDRRTCHNGGRRFEPARNNPVFSYLRDYFPITLVKTAELDPTRKYVFGAHPHGLMAVGMVCTFGSNCLEFERVFPGISARLLVLGGWFRLPITREHFLSLGMCSVSKDSIDCILSQGEGSAVVVPVGGAAEVLEARPETVSLVLKNRKGFVKRAIINGASLVPVYSFGENELFSMYHSEPGSVLRWLQNTLKKLIGVYVPIVRGRGIFQYTFGILPYRRPIAVIVGKPITVTKSVNPSEEEVGLTHKLYMESLEKLFDEHKSNYGQKDVKMKFV